MKQKLLKTGVFIACLLTLGGGSFLTYRIFGSASVSQFTPDAASTRLESDPASARKRGSLLSASPYTEEVTRKAENRVRTRSPAFQREATLDEKTIEKFKTLVKSRKLSKEDDQYKTFIPDEAGTGLLVRTLVVLQLHGEKKSRDSGMTEGLEFIRTYFLENSAPAVQSMGQALSALPKEYVSAKTLLMTEMAHLAREKNALRSQVKNSLLDEYARTGGNSQGALALSILLQVGNDESWIQEVKESFEQAHPGDKFSEIVSVQQAR